jgi:hypothetical protein
MAKITVKELKGFRALNAVNIYVKLVWGLGLTYFNTAASFEDFLKEFDGYDLERKQFLLKWACLAIPLDDEEKEGLTRLAVDEDGVAYEKPSTAGMSASEVVEIMYAVVMKISELKLFFYAFQNIT